MTDSAGLTVVGVDGSDESTAAVRWAARRAAGTGAALRLVHAYTVPVMMPAAPFAAAVSPAAQEAYALAAEAVLGAAAEAARAEAARTGAGALDVATVAVAGSAAPTLVDASAEADLVVVGARGHGGFVGLLLGSVGVQVSSHARCPTAVVRGPDRPTGGPVVVGVDGSPPSDAALRFAFAEAARQGLELVAVHAWAMPLPTGVGEAIAALSTAHDPAEYERAARQVLVDALAPWCAAFPDVRVRRQHPPDGASAALLRAAQDASMVVIGSRGHGGFTGLLLGSTSQNVLHHAPCPVVVTRAAADG